MTLLQIMRDHDQNSVLTRTRDQNQIGELLAPFGITLQTWDVHDLSPNATDDEIIAAYDREIASVREIGDYTVIDVVRLVPDPTNEEWVSAAATARSRFLDEHRHAENEVRFFVEGHGCFYLHLGDKVYALVCETGDLVSVPAGTTHWFDMGEVPGFCAIRFFEKADGWVGQFTGDPIASRMPTLDELVA